MTWFWLDIPLAALFFLAWTLIPLRMVFRHPDTGPGIPAPDEHPPRRAAPTMARSAHAPGQSTPVIPASPAGHRREEALAGHH